MRAETWSFSPLFLVAALLVAAVELGTWRLRRRCSPALARTWRRRALLFDAAVLAVCLIDASPLMGVAMAHLTVHMVLHVIEMFYLPIVLVLAAPFLPLVFAMPVPERRAILRFWNLGRLSVVTTAIGRVVTAPIVALVAFNATMLFWHLPRFFNWASWNPWVHTWLMTPSFVIAGYLFWRLMLPSGPYGPRASTRFQILAVMVTAFEMVFLAIAMGVLSHSAWYAMNLQMLGPTTAFSDQQAAAGVLWVCGDFWVIPALIVIARRIIDDAGGVSAAFEQALGRA